MEFVDYSKQRYDAALQQIERLKQSEFPYPHAKNALEQIESLFKSQRIALDKLSPKSSLDIAKNACSQSLAFLFHYTPKLGFVLRSTNVRNAFELYAPILRLARKLLGPNTKILLSSEWNYSPHIYLPTNELKEVALIGVPAFESANPLLSALAGHELGHNVWSNEKVAVGFEASLKQNTLDAIRNLFWADFQQYCPNATKTNLESDMFVQQSWVPVLTSAKRQLEEVFCDMIGLRLFGKAYLYAFAYLISPGTPGERSFYYPKTEKRIEFLLKAGNTKAIAVPDKFDELFDSDQDISNPVMKLLVDIADRAIEPFVDDVIDKAFSIVDSKGIDSPDETKTARIQSDFEMVMPADGDAGFFDIINAGWNCFHNASLWEDLEQIHADNRIRVLYDLILKSLEVQEYAERIA